MWLKVAAACLSGSTHSSADLPDVHSAQRCDVLLLPLPGWRELQVHTLLTTSICFGPGRRGGSLESGWPGTIPACGLPQPELPTLPLLASQGVPCHELFTHSDGWNCWLRVLMQCTYAATRHLAGLEGQVALPCLAGLPDADWLSSCPAPCTCPSCPGSAGSLPRWLAGVFGSLRAVFQITCKQLVTHCWPLNAGKFGGGPR